MNTEILTTDRYSSRKTQALKKYLQPRSRSPTGRLPPDAAAVGLALPAAGASPYAAPRRPERIQGQFQVGLACRRACRERPI